VIASDADNANFAVTDRSDGSGPCAM